MKSTYTYLLKQEEHRDATAWGVRLLELNDQDMNLDYTIADGGKGLRSGQTEAWPNVPCRGDVFHPLYDIGKVIRFLENRAEATIQAVKNLEKKMARAKKKAQGCTYSRYLEHARAEANTAVQLKSDIFTLSKWLKEAIQSLSKETVRASSIVENLNSRLRGYFFLRKTLDSGYLEILQFFLNHRRFMRSTRLERVGKSPAELLTGKPHDHWPEILGYNLFKKPRLGKNSAVKTQKAA
ncbi:hypothetical protein N9Y92_02950 [Chlamydiales bacterium]|nr:hypothetical protein [Chlamydiales bacterium]